MANKTIKATTNPPTVPQGLASQQTAAWRTFIGQNGFAEQAFFLRLEDILAALNISDITLPENYSQTGIRVYMALEQLPVVLNGMSYRTHLYVVGTDGQINDIVTDSQINSLIYDTTIPCPDLCSTANILNSPLT